MRCSVDSGRESGSLDSRHRLWTISWMWLSSVSIDSSSSYRRHNPLSLSRHKSLSHWHILLLLLTADTGCEQSPECDLAPSVSTDVIIHCDGVNIDRCHIPGSFTITVTLSTIIVIFPVTAATSAHITTRSCSKLLVECSFLFSMVQTVQNWTKNTRVIAESTVRYFHGQQYLLHCIQ